MVQSLWGEWRAEDPTLLTACLQLPGAGLNSPPLAVTLSTPASACCSGLLSVPDELLNILEPPGGQGCPSLAERWQSLCVPPSAVHACAHTPGLLWLHTTSQGACLVHLSSPNPSTHRKSPRQFRLRRAATLSAPDLCPQLNSVNLLCDFGQVPFPVSLGTMRSLRTLTLSEQECSYEQSLLEALPV